LGETRYPEVCLMTTARHEGERMTWRVRVDAGRCISSGMCVGIAPERFRFDDEQHSRPVSELIDNDEMVLDAAASCPVEAISVTDAETGASVELD
jgi:ferredoxin